MGKEREKEQERVSSAAGAELLGISRSKYSIAGAELHLQAFTGSVRFFFSALLLLDESMTDQSLLHSSPMHRSVFRIYNALIYTAVRSTALISTSLISTAFISNALI